MLDELKTTFIYILKCPKTGNVRYVGKSNDPKRRYYAHIRTDKTASCHKINWIQKLLKEGFKPELEILEEVSEEDWKERERFYISKYRELYDLTNCKDGGEGLFRGNQTSFKKGQISHNKGSRKKKKCVICGNFFEVSPSGDKKYKCCSMKCSAVYQSNFPNKGAFKKGHVSNNLTPVLQIDKNSGKVIVKHNSIVEAQEDLNILHISDVINGNRKTAGGFKWERA